MRGVARPARPARTASGGGIVARALRRAGAVVGGAAGPRRLGVGLAALLGLATWTGAAAAQQPAKPASASGPIAQFGTHVVATHYLRGQAYETHHYFKQLRDGVLQGLVFRQAAEGAPLIEVEWAISGDVYGKLPDWQKEYWHPLAPAVDAGRVRLPDLAEAQEREMLRTVRGLYAQTIDLAGIEGELPTGLEGVAMVTHLTREEMLRALHPADRDR